MLRSRIPVKLTVKTSTLVSGNKLNALNIISSTMLDDGKKNPITNQTVQVLKNSNKNQVSQANQPKSQLKQNKGLTQVSEIEPLQKTVRPGFNSKSLKENINQAINFDATVSKSKPKKVAPVTKLPVFEVTKGTNDCNNSKPNVAPSTKTTKSTAVKSKTKIGLYGRVGIKSKTYAIETQCKQTYKSKSKISAIETQCKQVTNNNKSTTTSSEIQINQTDKSKSKISINKLQYRQTDCSKPKISVTKNQNRKSKTSLTEPDCKQTIPTKSMTCVNSIQCNEFKQSELKTTGIIQSKQASEKESRKLVVKNEIQSKQINECKLQNCESKACSEENREMKFKKLDSPSKFTSLQQQVDFVAEERNRNFILSGRQLTPSILKCSEGRPGSIRSQSLIYGINRLSQIRRQDTFKQALDKLSQKRRQKMLDTKDSSPFQMQRVSMYEKRNIFGCQRQPINLFLQRTTISPTGQSYKKLCQQRLAFSSNKDHAWKYQMEDMSKKFAAMTSVQKPSTINKRVQFNLPFVEEDIKLENSSQPKPHSDKEEMQNKVSHEAPKSVLGILKKTTSTNPTKCNEKRVPHFPTQKCQPVAYPEEVYQRVAKLISASKSKSSKLKNPQSDSNEVIFNKENTPLYSKENKPFTPSEEALQKVADLLSNKKPKPREALLKDSVMENKSARRQLFTSEFFESLSKEPPQEHDLTPEMQELSSKRLFPQSEKIFECKEQTPVQSPLQNSSLVNMTKDASKDILKVGTEESVKRSKLLSPKALIIKESIDESISSDRANYVLSKNTLSLDESNETVPSSSLRAQMGSLQCGFPMDDSSVLQILSRADQFSKSQVKDGSVAKQIKPQQSSQMDEEVQLQLQLNCKIQTLESSRRTPDFQSSLYKAKTPGSKYRKLWTPQPKSFRPTSSVTGLSPDLLCGRTPTYISDAPIQTPMVLKALSLYSPQSPVCQKLDFGSGDDEDTTTNRTASYNVHHNQELLQQLRRHQSFLDQLADQECNIILNDVYFPQHNPRFHCSNPIASLLLSGDNMHFVPLTTPDSL